MSDAPPPPPPGYGSGQPAPPPPPPPSGVPGYGAPGYGASGYGAAPMPPGYMPNAYGGTQRDHPDGTTVLVLGILGLVVCNILAPIAWVKGHSARKEMAAQPGVYFTNKGNITAGWVCGIIGTVWIAFILLFFVIFIVIGVAAA